jgi:hypothetical protein
MERVREHAGLGAGRAAAGVFIVDHPDCCVEHRHGEHHRDQQPEQPGWPAVVLDDLPAPPAASGRPAHTEPVPTGARY